MNMPFSGDASLGDTSSDAESGMSPLQRTPPVVHQFSKKLGAFFVGFGVTLLLASAMRGSKPTLAVGKDQIVASDWNSHPVSTSIKNATAMTRGERLCQGGTQILYHQTDKAACDQLIKQGFDMSRAKPGNLGAGVYFADDAATTNYKTRHKGCIIKALVRLGNVLELGDRWLQNAGRTPQTCDPLLGYKLAMPGGEHVDSLTTIKHGRERSIFFTDQIVDMIAYPCTKNGTRTGDFVAPAGEPGPGRGTLTADKVDPSCPSHTVSTYTHLTGDQSAEMNEGAIDPADADDSA